MICQGSGRVLDHVSSVSFKDAVWIFNLYFHGFLWLSNNTRIRGFVLLQVTKVTEPHGERVPGQLDSSLRCRQMLENDKDPQK